MRRFAILLAATLLAACHSAPPIEHRDARVKIDWLGHNSFRLRSSLGITIITDPFDPKFLDYPAPKDTRADIVLISHEQSCCNDIDLVSGFPQIFRSSTGIGNNRASGLLVSGIATYPPGQSPSPDGLNTVYTWSMDGLRFCHLGEIHGPLSAQDVLTIGEADVVFLPVGGPPDLTNQGRRDILRALKPAVIVPMGYNTRFNSRMKLGSLGSWLGGQKNVVRLRTSSFFISRISLPIEPTILVPALP